MNSPSVDIKDMLVAVSALDLTFGSTLFIGKEPASPHQCVTIYDTPGKPTALNMDSSEKYYYPSVQVRVRSDQYLTGWNLINDIKEALHGRAHETWNSCTYELIESSEASMLTWDDNERVIFIININLQRR